MRQEMMGFWADSGISWTIRKQSAARPRQITTTTPQDSVFTGQTPNQQCQSTEALTITASENSQLWQCGSVCD